MDEIKINQLTDFVYKQNFEQKIFNEDFYHGDLYHYTSPQGMNSILFSNKDNIELFASRYDCLNDISEGKYVISVYKDVIDELLSENKITYNQYRYIKDITPYSNKVLMGENDMITTKSYNYVCCFSTDKDSLAMWNYYSKDSKYQGYNIKIDGEKAVMNLLSYRNLNITVRWCRMIYSLKKQKQIIRNYLTCLIRFFDDNDDINTMLKSFISVQLKRWAIFFKPSYFYHEKEVRVVISIPKDIENNDLPILYRQNGMFIIPYIKLKLDKRCVSSVTISPLYCTNDEKQHQIDVLSEWLKKENYESCDVKISNIPIRY